MAFSSHQSGRSERESRSQHPQIPADFVGTVLLVGRGRIRVSVVRVVVGRILRNGLLPGGGILPFSFRRV